MWKDPPDSPNKWEALKVETIANPYAEDERQEKDHRHSVQNTNVEGISLIHDGVHKVNIADRLPNAAQR